ncbi:MAG: hypothetical protein ACKPKO_20570 [Candidatus Fonsibacter sp.]
MLFRVYLHIVDTNRFWLGLIIRPEKKFFEKKFDLIAPERRKISHYFSSKPYRGRVDLLNEHKKMGC